MHDCVWRGGWIVIAISLCTLPAGAVATGSKVVRLAQNASDVGRGAATEPNPPLVAGVPASLPANSPEQVRKAQTELRRLDCLKGRIDGKLGDQTRQAVKDFWTSAKLAAGEINITDELISNLAERGDGFCRPVRRFFGFGSRLPSPFALGARPGSVPAAAAPPPAPEAAH
jgi:peptidoglycan hydrolase-like protein with peptidoglycan-binding domain